MGRQDADLSQDAGRFMKNSELSQDRAPVVVDLFFRQTIILIKGVHRAQRECDFFPGGGKTTPAARGGYRES
jgi:hypothetical protein